MVWCCRRPVIVGGWQRWQNNRLMIGARWCSYGLLGGTITALQLSCLDRWIRKTLFNNDKRNQVDIGFLPRLGEFLPPTLLQHSCGVQPTETIWPRPAARSFKMAPIRSRWLARCKAATAIAPCTLTKITGRLPPLEEICRPVRHGKPRRIAHTYMPTYMSESARPVHVCLSSALAGRGALAAGR